MIIYMFTSPSNKSYIGMTTDLKRRKRRHVADAMNGSDLPFHHAIRKYGIENFREEILADVDQDQNYMRFLEIEFIEKYDTVKKGYNCTRGGGGALGTKWNTGRKQTPERITHRANKMRGFKQSDYQKQRVKETKGQFWIVTFPDGHTEEVFSLNAFCKEHGLDQGNLSRGRHRDYRARKKEPA